MPKAAPRGRALTVFAVGCVLLDGVLLLLAGVWSGHPGLIAGAVICGILAVGVLFLWRRQQRLLAEMVEARQAVRDEALALRDLLRR